jgi:hypothetical protein
MELFPQVLLAQMIQLSQLFKVDTQADRNDQVQDRPSRRPCFSAGGIITQLPKREEHKKHCGGAHEDFVGGNQFHSR